MSRFWRSAGAAGHGGGGSGLAKPAALGLGTVVVVLLAAVLTAPMLLFAGAAFLYSTGGCAPGRGGTAAGQPSATAAARNSIPAQYLALFKSVGARYGVPWVILAGIGKVESDDGRTTLPGVHSGANAFGAAGPMQIGIGGAAGNTWGGTPVHQASEHVSGVATDANGDGTASVYDPADAIAGAAVYLLAHGVTSNVAGAIFAYNHLDSYVQAVLGWASLYASGGFTVDASGGIAAAGAAADCIAGVAVAPSPAAAAAISFAEQQLGKPYLWGGTGPDAFDCSGLVMMAYRAAGIVLPRTSQQQWQWGPRVRPSRVEPGDLVFFAGGDGTGKVPGHVGIVIGPGLMINAPSPGQSVTVAKFDPASVVGFTRPWQGSGSRSGKGAHAGAGGASPGTA